MLAYLSKHTLTPSHSTAEHMSALASKVCIEPAALKDSLTSLKSHDPHQVPGSGKDAKKGGEAKAGGGNVYEERQAQSILKLFKDQFGNPTVSRGVWAQNLRSNFRLPQLCHDAPICPSYTNACHLYASPSFAPLSLHAHASSLKLCMVCRLYLYSVYSCTSFLPQQHALLTTLLCTLALTDVLTCKTALHCPVTG